MGCFQSSPAGKSANTASPVRAQAMSNAEDRKRAPTEDEKPMSIGSEPSRAKSGHHKQGSLAISHAAVALTQARGSVSDVLRRASSISMLSPAFLKKYGEDGSIDDIVVPFLSQFVMFRHLKKKELLKAARCFDVEKFEGNKSIIVKGLRGDLLYIIADGKVDVSAKNEAGVPSLIRTMGTNEIFGEFGLIHDVPRTVNVDAAKGGVVVVTLKRSIYKSYKNEPFMAKLRGWLDNAAHSIVSGALNQINFLSTLEKDKRHIISGLFRVQVVPLGHTVCKQGTKGKHFYVLSSGQLLVSAKDERGEEVELKTFTDGASFGEVSLLADTLRSATITAMKESVVLSLRREDFETFLRLVPSHGDEMKRQIRDLSAVKLVSEKIPFFQSISKDKIAEVAAVCSVTRHKAGTIIVETGKVDPLKFYIITEGMMDVYVGEKRVRTMGVGDYFGEVSLVLERPHTATVKVSTLQSYASCLECTKADFELLFASVPAVLAEISMRVLGKESEMRHVILHPLGRSFFLKHIEKEFAQENLDFWRDVDDLERLNKRTLSAQAIKTLGINPVTYAKEHAEKVQHGAQLLFKQYIIDDAPEQINLEDKTRRVILQRFAKGSIDQRIFHQAKDDIYNLMERDNFSRFKKSPLFQEMLSELGTYKRGKNEKRKSLFEKIEKIQRKSSKVVVVETKSSLTNKESL